MLSYSLPDRKPPLLPPENDLKIDILDDDVAELNKGVASLSEYFAGLDSHMLSVGQIVVKFGDHAEIIQVMLKPVKVQGYYAEIMVLAKNIDVRLNQKVTKLCYGSATMLVTVEVVSNFVTDNVILTVSLGVLKANLILFELISPEWNTAAISHLSVGNEYKVALRLDDVFWANRKFLDMVASISYVYGYFLSHQKVTCQLSMVCMVAGFTLHKGTISCLSYIRPPILKVGFLKPPAKPPDDFVLRDVSCCEPNNLWPPLSSHLMNGGCHIFYCSKYWDLGLPLIQRQETLVWTIIRICAWPELKKFRENMTVEANLKVIGQTRASVDGVISMRILFSKSCGHGDSLDAWKNNYFLKACFPISGNGPGHNYQSFYNHNLSYGISVGVYALRLNEDFNSISYKEEKLALVENIKMMMVAEAYLNFPVKKIRMGIPTSFDCLQRHTTRDDAKVVLGYGCLVWITHQDIHSLIDNDQDLQVSECIAQEFNCSVSLSMCLTELVGKIMDLKRLCCTTNILVCLQVKTSEMAAITELLTNGSSKVRIWTEHSEKLGGHTLKGQLQIKVIMFLIFDPGSRTFDVHILIIKWSIFEVTIAASETQFGSAYKELNQMKEHADCYFGYYGVFQRKLEIYLGDVLTNEWKSTLFAKWTDVALLATTRYHCHRAILVVAHYKSKNYTAQVHFNIPIILSIVTDGDTTKSTHHYLSLWFSLPRPPEIASFWLPLSFWFSLPRPPEVVDLEDKVNFKEGGMLRMGIRGNINGAFVF